MFLIPLTIELFWFKHTAIFGAGNYRVTSLPENSPKIVPFLQMIGYLGYNIIGI